MNIPSFVDLKKYLAPAERKALVLLLDAALGKSMAQVQTQDGIVREGWLNMRLPPPVQDAFEALTKKLT